MNPLIVKLGFRQQRGSKPRCHLLTHGRRDEVAARLTSLMGSRGLVSPDDIWMPDGFHDLTEAELHKADRLVGPAVCRIIEDWWLAVSCTGCKTPTFDIASTCTLGDEPGLLLVEAKAHDRELQKEQVGKQLKSAASANSRLNHARIGTCIGDASLGLSRETGQTFNLSRDWNYQMSNRFAISWKLAELKIPVVLVYLGFLNADEMMDKGRPFADHVEWENLVRAHSACLFPSEVWGRRWTLNGQPFIPLIRSITQAIL